MPVYEYQCTTCGDHFEKRQKFSDAPISDCPSCGGQVQKLISSVAFSLKGGGWYTEGYNKAGEKPAEVKPCASGGSCAGCPAAAA